MLGAITANPIAVQNVAATLLGEADEVARMLHTLRVKVEPGGKDL